MPCLPRAERGGAKRGEFVLPSAVHRLRSIVGDCLTTLLRKDFEVFVKKMSLLQKTHHNSIKAKQAYKRKSSVACNGSLPKRACGCWIKSEPKKYHPVEILDDISILEY